MIQTVAVILQSGKTRFIRKLGPKPDALHCHACQSAQTILFSAYWVWQPVSGHVSASSIPANEMERLKNKTNEQFSKMGEFCRPCFLKVLKEWEETPDTGD